MKRLRSSDDLYAEKGVVKDWGRREEDSGLQRSSSSVHRGSYYKSSDNGKKVLSSSTSRYDRFDDDRESSRLRKRSDYDLDNYDRRKSYDRHRDGNERGILSSSPRAGYGMDPMYRAESFSGARRDFPKGFRSERDRTKREGIAASWRRFGCGKDGDDGSRSSHEVSRGSRMDAKDVGKAAKSPQGVRDANAKSPAWSKDSESERSKSVECKKNEEMPVESDGHSSEREEGELEPDPQPLAPSTEPAEDEDGSELNSSHKGHDNEHLSEYTGKYEDVRDNGSFKEGHVNETGSVAEQAEDAKSIEDVVNKSSGLQSCKDTTSREGGGGKYDTIDTKRENEVVMEDKREDSLEEVADNTCGGKLPSVKETREEKSVNIEAKPDKAVAAEDLETAAEEELHTEKAIQPLKDKGKSVVSLPSSSVHFAETNLEAENKMRDVATSGDNELEGPSTMGFQFLSTDPIKKPEKVEEFMHSRLKDDKLTLDLSLSLPNVLLPIGSQNRGQAPGSPSHARSVQSLASSFRTNSDGFTASMSFSGSQQFTHNPSCSLTHNALDFEQSVGSKPLFQGVDWKALALEESKSKEGPPSYQGMGMLSRDNGLHLLQSQLTQGNSSGQGGVSHLRAAGGSSKLPNGLERQLSFNKNSSASQGFVAYEIGPGPEYSKDRKKLMAEKYGASLQRSNDPDGKEQIGADFAESIVTMIVSEPLNTMARRFNEMTGKHVECVKEFVGGIISNPSKKWQLSALQKAVLKRQDLTLDMLLNAHRTQLQILVALKTGLQEFLLQKNIPASDLAEIFLNMRCKNLSCRSLLPVDECDCKICSQRNDFCRECMCLVCSKFDMASNTCSWVGCDVCLHWCHADCGLREAHIRNGRSATGAHRTSEMQFYCVACDHPSEMFGFVKEVFQNFVKEWTAENLSRELEYVRKIFAASGDTRGKQLHEIAVRMLSKLANRAADLQEVQTRIVNFFTETDSDRPGNNPVEPRNELATKTQEGGNGNGIAGSSQGGGWMKSIYSEKGLLQLENPVNLLAAIDGGNRNDKYVDIRKPTEKEPILDELESMVRIKQAEAKMFQARADDARRESEALKRISASKSEKIEEEYSGRIRKLRVGEAEEMRKQKVEELQGVERAYEEYFNMKMRMETDIKDLLLKMEATRRNLTS
ncbi:protein OBERON 4 [Andrographis paniculata]|uniref:protein OBERON 4 n=1 Tax=Andrographis paniculata TaxID=175694 RepID=UPI0021E86443|nr:protein OBERON 4 [Andrographis paniculata]